MSRLRHLSVLLVAVVAVVAVATPASAGRQTTTDAARDVYRAPAGGGVPTLAPDNRTHDIVRAGTVHRGPRVTLWLQVRRLARTDYIASWHVRTPGETWSVHYDREEGPAITSLFHGSAEVLDCDGLLGRAVPRKERVVVTVPRACIGRPAWIRFGAWMRHETPTVNVIDDARIDAGFNANQPRLGPRVRHN
ncbi:hypothetical protein D0Z08_16990 [Nocardioides immobilis]|uniref:Uncharacterized protein n=1 Tax=Nocardioides immobilis TaxID=2049295 RepID=A0A417Y049_9ACTN|nr:hypothetical protein [Nocardioides immobilis]RHW26018.1 hypothetical protein D0Z08_16990 [Nocardioides immobilis]